MGDFIIDATQKSPSVKLLYNEGLFELKGNSILEDPETFYNPIIDKLDEYLHPTRESTTVIIYLTYYNSGTVRSLISLFKMIEKHHKQGEKISIQWHYKSNDTVLKEDGIDYNKLVDVPFQLVERDD